MASYVTIGTVVACVLDASIVAAESELAVWAAAAAAELCWLLTSGSSPCAAQ
tara:strand:+ start:362 stop:517 length:156 start_codon:yes stop_codon:yes gene_type:complete